MTLAMSWTLPRPPLSAVPRTARGTTASPSAKVGGRSSGVHPYIHKSIELRSISLCKHLCGAAC